jgi:ethanolamine-phosphate phospho-lyase
MRSVALRRVATSAAACTGFYAAHVSTSNSAYCDRPPSVVATSRAELTKEQVFKMRKELSCAAQSVSYQNTNPLWIVRGTGQYLYDEKGNAYLDTRNNVAHLGHTHPRVVKAVQDQVAQLNTNTRYLHQNLVQLAEKLTATMPEELCVCFFVNSGSEANDLAIRLARAHTKNKDMIVLERAYHGHTVGVIDISPYKYEHVGGPGKVSSRSLCCSLLYHSLPLIS